MQAEPETLELLRRISAAQEKLLDGQQEALALQREQFELARTQFERAERINDRAEKIQETSASLMAGARKAMIVILPIIFVLLVYLTWLIFR